MHSPSTIHSQAIHIIYIVVYCIHRLHLHNQSCEQDADSGHVGGNGDRPAYVDQFGFHIATCCGAIPLDNTWSSDWVVRTHICMLEKLFTIPKEFYARQRIEPQVAMAEQKVWYIHYFVL